MAAEPFRFVHSADLHLEQPVYGLAEAPDHLRDVLIDAPFLAAERVFDVTLNESADFLILAGDVLNVHDAGPRGIAFLLEQFERLAARDIPVYWMAGEEDPPEHWPGAARLPANVRLLSATESEHFTPSRLGQPLCQLAASDVKAAGGLFSIAVVHGEFDANSLAQQQIDYGALGGEHQRQSLFTAPHTAHFCGTPQGRCPAEAGPHGCTLVSVDGQRKVRTQFIATDAVRWHVERLTLDTDSTEDDVRRLLGQRMISLASESSPRTVLVDWKIESPLSQALHGALAIQLLNWLRDEFGCGDQPVWTAALEFESPQALPPDWLEEDTIRGDFLRGVKVHQADAEQPLDLSAYLPPRQAGVWKQALELSDHDVRQEVLRQAAALGVELLT